MAVNAKQQKTDPALVQVWERRMVNPGPDAGATIELKDKSFEVRWINTLVEGRFHQATRGEGWVPVRPSDLADDPELLGLQTDADMVRRGDKGSDILMKIPKAIFAKIRLKKAELVTKALKNTKGATAEAAANKLGANAADFIAGADGAAGRGITGMKGEIVDKFGDDEVDSE